MIVRGSGVCVVFSCVVRVILVEMRENIMVLESDLSSYVLEDVVWWFDCVVKRSVKSRNVSGVIDIVNVVVFGGIVSVIRSLVGIVMVSGIL